MDDPKSGEGGTGIFWVATRGDGKMGGDVATLLEEDADGAEEGGVEARRFAPPGVAVAPPGVAVAPPELAPVPPRRSEWELASLSPKLRVPDDDGG